jgi:hypothetical protein
MAGISRDYQHIIKQLSVDLDYPFYPEEKINISNPNAVHKLEGNFVLQCPALCRWLHAFDATIVMMIRPIDEIIRSELRVGWQGHRRKELRQYGLQDGVISKIKYDYWQSTQRALCKRWFEIDYHTLSNHPLWIPANERANFETRQISHHTVLPVAK